MRITNRCEDLVGVGGIFLLTLSSVFILGLGLAWAGSISVTVTAEAYTIQRDDQGSSVQGEGRGGKAKEPGEEQGEYLN
jgi:hypothetical protein